MEEICTLMGSAYEKAAFYLNQMALIQLFNLENVSLETSQRTTLF